MRRALTEAQAIIEDVDVGIVVIGASGRIDFANARARRALASFFPNGSRWGDALPGEVEDWLRAQREPGGDALAPRRPLVVDRDDRQLGIRLVHESGRCLLLLNERSATIDVPRLMALGLTSREAEVLSWLAQGKTDSEIGIIIGSRPKTVGKHLERIYKKLGVESRTAAVARAFEAAS